ncbi:MAG TPA: 1-acyl-sn-glycerol-3-phosphate acyltransferase [Thermoanaerobaculia bacterium]|nr:1-acyl-sn-glycerol-3-phosphate acyltransferase [Thermoanaerobaculia bacterium]
MERTAQEPFIPTPALTAVSRRLPIVPGVPSVPWRAGLDPLTAPLPHLRRPAARRLCRGLMLTLGQFVAVEHGERLEAVSEPAIFALNHRNRVEALLAPAVLIYLRHGAPLHFLADWMFLEAPGLGWLLRQGEPVAVYRKPAIFKWRDRHRRERLRRPVLDACLEHLERGESVGFFPEGARNRDGGRLLRGRLGLGELALRAAVPVVPVAIKYPERDGRRAPGGALHWRPPGGTLDWRAPGGAPDRRAYGWPTRMVLAIGEPLDCAAERRQLSVEPKARRVLARRIVDRVMAALAAELGKDYAAPHPRSEAR